MTELDNWLKQATRRLANDSSAKVRGEIQAHYESALDAAINSGVTTDEAERKALAALGDAKAVNRQYRSVLLTSAEARILRQGNCEARAICSRPWLRWSFAVLPFIASAAMLLAGSKEGARELFVVGTFISLLSMATSLPIYTPARGRIFRFVKWIALLGFWFGLLSPAGLAVKWSWLLFSCMWPMASAEWTRASIRRKLPVAQWPRQLYL
jgi:hypothetical protein